MFMGTNPNVFLLYAVSVDRYYFSVTGSVTGCHRNLVTENKNQGFRPFVEIPETDNVYPIDSYDHSGVAGGIWDRFRLTSFGLDE